MVTIDAVLLGPRLHKTLKLRQINADERYKRDVKRDGPSGRALFFPKEMQMLARDLMTTDVSVVPPEMPARKIAAVLLDGGISAVPVVDVSGAPIGMVSEGDLLGRRQDEHSRRREWWLTILAEGESLSPEFISQLRSDELTARELMTAPVITVSESTEAAEIADLLSTYRIKRVPVLRDGKIVGSAPARSRGRYSDRGSFRGSAERREGLAAACGGRARSSARWPVPGPGGDGD